MLSHPNVTCNTFLPGSVVVVFTLVANGAHDDGVANAMQSQRLLVKFGGNPILFSDGSERESRPLFFSSRNRLNATSNLGDSPPLRNFYRGLSKNT